MTPSPDDVMRFWREAGPTRWFTKDEAFDAGFRTRFLEAHLAAARGELDGWAATAEGALALLILLDQYPRNAFRGTAHMYATDPLARRHARALIAAGFDQRIEPELRLFCYLPLSHSEALADQRDALALQRALDPEAARHAQGHHDIVARFGRFPHRNLILGRESSDEERAFLAAGGFAG